MSVGDDPDVAAMLELVEDRLASSRENSPTVDAAGAFRSDSPSRSSPPSSLPMRSSTQRRTVGPPSAASVDPFGFPPPDAHDDDTAANLGGDETKQGGTVGSDAYKPYRSAWYTLGMDRAGGWSKLNKDAQQRLSHVARIEEGFGVMRNPPCRACVAREARDGAGSSPCNVYTNEASAIFETGGATRRCSRCRTAKCQCE